MGTWRHASSRVTFKNLHLHQHHLHLGRSRTAVVQTEAGMELRHLRYFVAAAEAQSLRGAAEITGLSLPTLSRGVRRLEDELGVSLFERHREGVRLTAAGTSFLRDTHRVLSDLDAAVVLAGRAGRAEVGQLSVGFFTSLVSGRLHDLLAACRHVWADVALSFVEGPYPDQLAAVRDRRLDVGIYAGDVEVSTIETLDLWSEPLLAALPDRHPLAARGSLDWPSLATEVVLMRSWESGPIVYNFFASRLSPKGYMPRIDQHAVARENLLGLVGAGFGVTIVAEPATGATYPGVVFRPIAEPDAFLPIKAAWLPGNDNPLLRRFVSFLREEVRRHGTVPPTGSTASPSHP